MTAFLQVLLGLLLQSTCLLLLGLIALWLTRKYGPAVQTLVGRATLSGVALLLLLAPLSGHVRPLWRIPTPQQAATLPKREGEPMVDRGVRLASPKMSDRDMPSPARPPVLYALPINQETSHPNPASPSRFGRVAACCGVGLWLAISSILLLWLAVCQGHLTRLRRRASLITSGSALTLLAELTSNPPLLLTHPSVHSPFLAGLRRPAIFLPAAYETEFDTTTLRAILAHELAHRDRRDNAWTLLARLLTAALWPQPLLWLLCRRLEQISEDACDEAVLASDCPPHAYADCLLTLAERRQPNRRQRTLTASVAPFRSSLGRRVQHILSKGTRSMSTVSTHLRLTIAALTVIGAIGGVFLVSSAPAQVNKPVSLTKASSVKEKQVARTRTVIGYGLISMQFKNKLYCRATKVSEASRLGISIDQNSQIIAVNGRPAPPSESRFLAICHSAPPLRLLLKLPGRQPHLFVFRTKRPFQVLTEAVMKDRTQGLKQEIDLEQAKLPAQQQSLTHCDQLLQDAIHQALPQGNTQTQAKAVNLERLIGGYSDSLQSIRETARHHPERHGELPLIAEREASLKPMYAEEARLFPAIAQTRQQLARIHILALRWRIRSIEVMGTKMQVSMLGQQVRAMNIHRPTDGQ